MVFFQIMQTELNEQDEQTIFIGFDLWMQKQIKLKTNANEKRQGFLQLYKKWCKPKLSKVHKSLGSKWLTIQQEGWFVQSI